MSTKPPGATFSVLSTDLVQVPLLCGAHVHSAWVAQECLVVTCKGQCSKWMPTAMAETWLLNSGVG